MLRMFSALLSGMESSHFTLLVEKLSEKKDHSILYHLKSVTSQKANTFSFAVVINNAY